MQAQPHLTHPPVREAFPIAVIRHSTYPFHPRRCTGVTAHTWPGEMCVQPSLPRRYIAATTRKPMASSRPAARRLKQSSLLPSKVPEHSAPLPLQALTSQQQHCSFSITAREELNVISAVGRMAAGMSYAEPPGTSMPGFAGSNLQGGLAHTILCKSVWCSSSAGSVPAQSYPLHSSRLGSAT